LAKIAVKQKEISPNDPLLKPKYYLSPDIDQDWLKQTLIESFKGIRHCLTLSDSTEIIVKHLHGMGYSGTLWNMLISSQK
ncbi:MAG: B12-binding domain-containing radical SAM protein, partial [Planctomycetota bacterium]